MALKIKHWLACGVAFAALPTAALAQTTSTESVTVDSHCGHCYFAAFAGSGSPHAGLQLELAAAITHALAAGFFA